MIEYQYIHFHATVRDPQSANASTRREIMMSHNADKRHVLKITRDGDTVSLECMHSGRVVETPWSSVRYAERSVKVAPKVVAPIPAPKVLNKKAEA